MYGLIDLKNKNKNKQKDEKEAKKNKSKSIFDDSDEDENRADNLDPKKRKLPTLSRVITKQYAEEQIKAISEDPDIFDFDAWKDKVQEEETPVTEEEKRERKKV